MYENKISFKETLEQAIKNGFAEQDSSADLSGKMLCTNLFYSQIYLLEKSLNFLICTSMELKILS